MCFCSCVVSICTPPFHVLNTCDVLMMKHRLLLLLCLSFSSCLLIEGEQGTQASSTKPKQEGKRRGPQARLFAPFRSDRMLMVQILRETLMELNQTKATDEWPTKEKSSAIEFVKIFTSVSFSQLLEMSLNRTTSEIHKNRPNGNGTILTVISSWTPWAFCNFKIMFSPRR